MLFMNGDFYLAKKFVNAEGSICVDIRDLLVALILGFVEGLTEFAPISSTGHMIIVDDLLFQSYTILGSAELANTFKVVIQFGSILAVVVIFWRRLVLLTRQSLQTNKNRENTHMLRLSHIVVGLIPAIIFGFLLEGTIDRYLFRVETVIFGLISGAILMLLADRLRAEQSDKHISLDAISYKQAFLIGLYQCLALWPGFSRSGATISGGVLLGLNYRAAADFTFIMAIPIMFGASVLSLYKKWDIMTIQLVPFFTVGFISAFIFALLAIQIFLQLISKIKLKPFAIYRLILALVIIVVYALY